MISFYYMRLHIQIAGLTRLYIENDGGTGKGDEDLEFHCLTSQP